jgi:hypothetical protein
MIVIDVLGLSLAADGAQTALPSDELADLIRANPIAATEVIVPRVAMAFLHEPSVARVVARLAITVVSRTVSFVPRKLNDRLGATTGCAREVRRGWEFGSHDMASFLPLHSVDTCVRA